DGLFNDAVIVCEGDADCRFYATALERITQGKRSLQVLFTHCGGKARIAQVVSALAAIGVPGRVIADFDVLQNETDVKRIVTALSGDWNVVDHDYQIVKTAMDGLSKNLQKNFVRQELDTALNEVTDATLSDVDLKKLRAIIKAPTSWEDAKTSGISKVPS